MQMARYKEGMQQLIVKTGNELVAAGQDPVRVTSQVTGALYRLNLGRHNKCVVCGTSFTFAQIENNPLDDCCSDACREKAALIVSSMSKLIGNENALFLSMGILARIKPHVVKMRAEYGKYTNKDVYILALPATVRRASEITEDTALFFIVPGEKTLVPLKLKFFTGHEELLNQVKENFPPAESIFH